MTKPIVILGIALLTVSCMQTPPPPPVAGPFVGIDWAALPEHDRRTLSEASADFNAVASGKKPVYAIFDEQAPLPSDGGTTYYQGKGYRLTILMSLSSFGAFRGTAYGPILRFDPPFAPGNTSEISDVRVYSRDALSKLLQR